MPPGGSAPPSDVSTTFGPAGSGSATGGPCILDPEADSLFPQQLAAAAVRGQPGAGEDVFEIRLHADIETNDLVVYTTATVWTMPAAMWQALSTNVVDKPITVSVRGLASSTGTVALGPTETITIAPVQAQGTIVYWTTSGGSALKGFAVGQESVVTVITPSNTPGQCVGCHSSTPGGRVHRLFEQHQHHQRRPVAHRDPVGHQPGDAAVVPQRQRHDACSSASRRSCRSSRRRTGAQGTT